VEVIRRKVRHRGQRGQIQRLVESAIDGLDHPVHPPLVFEARIAGNHYVLRVSSLLRPIVNERRNAVAWHLGGGHKLPHPVKL
jgi:hypothetical protein